MGRDHSLITITGKQTQLGEISFIINQTTERQWQIKADLKSPFLTPPVSQSSTWLPIFSTSSQWCSRTRNTGCSQYIRHCLCCSSSSGGGLLTLCTCSIRALLTSPRVLAEPVRCGLSTGTTAFLRHSPAVEWGPPGVCRWVATAPCCHMGTAVSPCQHHGLWGNLLQFLEHLLPLLHWPWCLQSCSPHMFSLFSAAVAQQPFFHS